MRCSSIRLSRLTNNIKPWRKRLISTLFLCILLSQIVHFLSHRHAVGHQTQNRHKSTNITTVFSPTSSRHTLHNTTTIPTASTLLDHGINSSSTLILIICRAGCGTKLIHTLKQTLSSYTNARVEVILAVPTSTINLDDPPIPIIGTGGIGRRRLVYSSEVSMFGAHLSAWRLVFHGNVKRALVIECDDDTVWIEGLVREVFTKRDVVWDVLVYGRSYGLTWVGVDRLLSVATAYTMSVHEFVDVIGRSGRAHVRVMRKGDVQRRSCGEMEVGEVRGSDEFPFHAPLHWIYGKGKDRARRNEMMR